MHRLPVVHGHDGRKCQFVAVGLVKRKTMRVPTKRVSGNLRLCPLTRFYTKFSEDTALSIFLQRAIANSGLTRLVSYRTST